MLKGKGILTAFQAEVLRAFSRLPDADQFYLAGGTALSEFFFAHRLSYDLDLFTSQKGLVVPFSRSLEALLPEMLGKGTSVKTIRRFETFVEYEISGHGESVRVQLVLDSPFRFSPPEASELGVLVNNFEDITTDKFLAYFGRSEPRDAIDLFFILRTIDIQTLIGRARQKDPGFDTYWLAIAFQKASKFPDELHRWPVTMKVEVDIAKLKVVFSDLATRLLDDIRPK